MSYRSGFELLGIPFVHVAMSTVEDGVWKRGIARGWIAIGDVAFGVLFRRAVSPSAGSRSAGFRWE